MPHPDLKKHKFYLLECNTYPSRDPRLRPLSKRQRWENSKKKSLKSQASGTIRVVRDIPLEPVEKFKEQEIPLGKAGLLVDKDEEANVVNELTKATPQNVFERDNAVNAQETKSIKENQKKMEQGLDNRVASEATGSSEKSTSLETKMLPKYVDEVNSVAKHLTGAIPEATVCSESQAKSATEDPIYSEDNIELELSKLLDEDDKLFQEFARKSPILVKSKMSSVSENSIRQPKIDGSSEKGDMLMTNSNLNTEKDANKIVTNDKSVDSEKKTAKLLHHLDLICKESDKIISDCVDMRESKSKGNDLQCNDAMSESLTHCQDVEHIPNSHEDCDIDKYGRPSSLDDASKANHNGPPVTSIMEQTGSSPGCAPENMMMKNSEVDANRSQRKEQTRSDSAFKTTKKDCENTPRVSPKLISLISEVECSNDLKESNEASKKKDADETKNELMKTSSSIFVGQRAWEPETHENKKAECLLKTQWVIEGGDQSDLSLKLTKAREPQANTREVRAIALKCSLAEAVLSEGEIISSPESISLTPLDYNLSFEEKLSKNKLMTLPFSKQKASFAENNCTEQSTSRADHLQKPKRPKLRDSSPMCRNYCRQKLSSCFQPDILHTRSPHLESQRKIVLHGKRSPDSSLEREPGRLKAFRETTQDERTQEHTKSPSPRRHYLKSKSSKCHKRSSKESHKRSRSPKTHHISRLHQSHERWRSPRACRWSRSRSPESHERSRSRRAYRRSRSRSPGLYGRSRSPRTYRRSRSRSHERLRSPRAYRRSRSRSPGLHERLRSPRAHRRSRSSSSGSHETLRSPRAHRRSRSRSPGSHERLRSPRAHRRSRSSSPGSHERLRSPRTYRRLRSRSPGSHERLRSPRAYRKSRSKSSRSCEMSRSPKAYRMSWSRSPRSFERSRSATVYRVSRSKSPRSHERLRSPRAYIWSRSRSPRSHGRLWSPGSYRRSRSRPNEKTRSPRAYSKYHSSSKSYRANKTLRSPKKHKRSRSRSPISLKGNAKPWISHEKMLSPCFLHREYEFSKVFNESNKSKFSLAKSSSPLSIFLDEDHFPLPHECQKSWNPCYLECEKQSHESLLQLEIKQVGHQSDEIPQEKMPVPVLASRIDNAISKLHKNQEANLPPSGQCPSKFSNLGTLYSDEQGGSKGTLNAKSFSTEDLRWQIIQRKRASTTKLRHLSDPLNSSEKTSHLSGKPCSGIIMATVEPLLKSSK